MADAMPDKPEVRALVDQIVDQLQKQPKIVADAGRNVSVQRLCLQSRRSCLVSVFLWSLTFLRMLSLVLLRCLISLSLFSGPPPS
jgi:hypothetical protein